MTCMISHIDHFEETVKPVIVSFENGSLQPGQEDKVLCRYYRNKDGQLQIGAATDNMLYSGEVKPRGLYNTFIGICNKRKTKMRLVAVDIAELSPTLHDSGKVNRTIEALEGSTAHVNKSFGSKRTKRKTEQRERMKVDIEAIKDELEKTVADVVINPSDMVVNPSDDTDSEYKPNINRQAETLSEVYNVDDIVPPAVLASVSDLVNKILEDGSSIPSDTSYFISNQISKVTSSSQDGKVNTIQLLLYIDCLIKFMGKPAKELGVRSLNLCSYSKVVHDDIMKRYTIMSKKSRLRPNSMRDKCVCSILILAMIACKYQLNLEVLAKLLKTSLKRIQDISRVLAFEVHKDLAVLKLPLPPPVSLNNTKRKKK